LRVRAEERRGGARSRLLRAGAGPSRPLTDANLVLGAASEPTPGPRAANWPSTPEAAAPRDRSAHRPPARPRYQPPAAAGNPASRECQHDPRAIRVVSIEAAGMNPRGPDPRPVRRPPARCTARPWRANYRSHASWCRRPPGILWRAPAWLVADLRHDLVRTHPRAPMPTCPPRRRRAVLDPMLDEARQSASAADRVPDGPTADRDARLTCAIIGQSYELAAPASAAFTDADWTGLASAFHAEPPPSALGTADPQAPIEIVSFAVTRDGG